MVKNGYLPVDASGDWVYQARRAAGRTQGASGSYIVRYCKLGSEKMLRIKVSFVLGRLPGCSALA